jgi:hypothetical protein
MLRALSVFLLMFSLLSLLVRLTGMCEVLGMAAIALFAIDGFVTLFAKERPAGIERESQL